VAKKPSWARTGQRALGGLLTSSAAQKEVGCARRPASRPLALVASAELGAHPKLALLMLRSIPPQGSIPDQARRRASGSFSEYPFCYESHARVRTPACGGTATRSHGAAPAQECRLRLKRLPPKALPWFPPFKSSTPERFRGSCPFASSPAVANGKPVLPFWKEKLRSWGSFSLQNGITKNPGGKGRTRANTAESRLCGMTAV
jgi:hypothetical protein